MILQLSVPVVPWDRYGATIASNVVQGKGSRKLVWVVVVVIEGVVLQHIVDLSR